MLFKKTVHIYCTNHTQYTNTLCWQNTEFFSVTIGGTYSYQWTLRVKFYHPRLYTDETKTHLQCEIYHAR